MSRQIMLAAAILILTPSTSWPGAMLGGGKRAMLANQFGFENDVAAFNFGRDEALVTGPSPLCPATSQVELTASNQATQAFALPCARWTVAGKTYRYTDREGAAGPVRSVVYRPSTGRLRLRVKGEGYSGIAGPVTFVDALFSVGSAGWCGRFRSFTKNTQTQVIGKGPTVACGSCGNGIREGFEQCDDGNLVSGDGCDTNCTPTACGNGVKAGGEQCDDGNTASGDGCRADCTAEVCGDAVLDAGEQCDDGNVENGDCCSATCAFEPDGSSCSDGSLCTAGDRCTDGMCRASLVPPWINEFDYDGGSTGGTPDRDEFVEIAGPAGADLSGYTLLSIEGNALCLTGQPGVTDGNANLSATIPPGTVIGDDTGTGIGFVVACFTNTSANLVAAGKCDVVLSASGLASNLQDGDPLNNLGLMCPDGVLLLDAANATRDAVSYEGIVPATGTYGARFHVTSYDAGQDQGQKLGVSLEKTPSTLGAATSAPEWRLSGGCTTAATDDAACVEGSATPGAPNPGQSLRCAEFVCGDGVVGGPEECDEGANNSNAPDASCRTDCTAQRCGDEIVDPGHGEQCETDADCGSGGICLACGCVQILDFTVLPGPSASAPQDDGESSWLRVTPILGSIENGTRGDFNPGPITIARGEPDANGIADLFVMGTAYVGAHLPQGGGSGSVCFRIEQDPEAIGSVDCDGGSNFDVTVSADSHGTGANDPPTVTVGAGATDSGPGAAALRILLTGAQTSDDATPCSAASYTEQPTRTALTTATATAVIRNARQGGDTTVRLAGQPFTCSNWTSDSGASVAVPNLTFDIELPFGLGTQDIAQVLRLNDD